MNEIEVDVFARKEAEKQSYHPYAIALYHQGFVDGYFGRKKPALHDVEMLYYNQGYEAGSKMEG